MVGVGQKNEPDVYVYMCVWDDVLRRALAASYRKKNNMPQTFNTAGDRHIARHFSFLQRTKIWAQIFFELATRVRVMLISSLPFFER